jgi:hypothetical protein
MLMEVTVTSFSQTPMGKACERAQTFAPNMMLSIASNTMASEISQMEGDVTTMRQLVKERPDIAATLKAIIIIMEDREVSC